jgi:uncharacterized protein YcsI (UPF0317 family)
MSIPRSGKPGRAHPVSEDELADPRLVRRAIRSGRLTGYTPRCAPGYVQANLAILPAAFSEEFLRFCQRNPQPCPLLDVSEPGDHTLPRLAEDLDIRTDVPAYRIFKDGELVDEVADISSLWRDDLVIFALGCSMSTDQALLSAGVPVRHVERNEAAGMYVTSIETVPAGRFRGPMVVTMRPHKPADAIRAVQITTRFPKAHGAPVHIGLPELIGIRDLTRPDFGPERVELAEDEIPVFWACGVTPQVVVRHAKPPLCITHKPGHMLVTDLTNASVAVL